MKQPSTFSQTTWTVTCLWVIVLNRGWCQGHVTEKTQKTTTLYSITLQTTSKCISSPGLIFSNFHEIEIIIDLLKGHSWSPRYIYSQPFVHSPPVREHCWKSCIQLKFLELIYPKRRGDVHITRWFLSASWIRLLQISRSNRCSRYFENALNKGNFLLSQSMKWVLYLLQWLWSERTGHCLCFIWIFYIGVNWLCTSCWAPKGADRWQNPMIQSGLQETTLKYTILCHLLLQWFNGARFRPPAVCLDTANYYI